MTPEFEVMMSTGNFLGQTDELAIAWFLLRFQPKPRELSLPIEDQVPMLSFRPAGESFMEQQ
jgi:hypothetical protein